MLSIYDGRSHFWQWDSDQRLTVASASTCEVHFHNPDGDTALTLDTYTHNGKTVVDVPNILLQNEGRITAWIFICVGDECTVFEKTFEVWHRQKPADYVYTETQLKSWNDKLNLQQGAENAGAHMIVGEDGNVAPRQPGALTLTGAVEAEYNGSKAVEVEIPVQQPLTITKGDDTTTYDGSAPAAVDVPDVFIVREKQDESGASLADKTQEEIRAAVVAGKTCLLVNGEGRVFAYFADIMPDRSDATAECPAFLAPMEYEPGKGLHYWIAYVYPSREVKEGGYKPARTPNPQKLTLTSGEDSTSYDGSSAVTVSLPDVYIVKVSRDSSGELWSDRTQAGIRAAVEAGKTCILVDNFGRVFTYYGERSSDAGEIPTFIAPSEYVHGKGIYYQQCQILADGRVDYSGYSPARTPNPNALTLSGAVTATYDGNAPVEVEIPTEKLLIVTSTYDSAQGVSTPSSTYAEIKAAINAGKVPLFVSGGRVYTLVWSTAEKHRFERYYEPATYSSPAQYGIWRESADINADGTVTFGANTPTTTPNPHALTIKQGDTSTTYNGSSAVTVEITGGSGSGGGGLPSGSAPHQQLVTNATGATEWQERTHYEAITEGAVLAETSPTLVFAEDGAAMFMTQDAVNQPVIGETYKIVYNGTEYSCVCQDGTDIGEAGTAVFGNAGFLTTGESSGEPFVVMIPTPEMAAEVEATGLFYDITGLLDGTGVSAETMTLSITGPLVERKQLDEKYIPETIARKADIPVTSVNGNTGAVTITELPTVTTSQNGYFLRVVSGSWAAVKVNSAEGASF